MVLDFDDHLLKRLMELKKKNQIIFEKIEKLSDMPDQLQKLILLWNECQNEKNGNTID